MVSHFHYSRPVKIQDLISWLFVVLIMILAFDSVIRAIVSIVMTLYEYIVQRSTG